MAAHKKVTEFIQYSILFTIHMWEVKDVQVEGRKEPLTKARLYLWIGRNHHLRLAETLWRQQIRKNAGCLADEIATPESPRNKTL